MAGLTAAAATAGALLLFGSRLGDPLQAFTAVGIPVIGRGVPLLAAAVGLLAHVSVCVLWGALFGLIVPVKVRPLAVVIAALAVTVSAAIVHSYLLLTTLRLGSGLGGPRAPTGPVVALHIVFAIALLAGLYVARRTTPEPRVQELSRDSNDTLFD